MTESELQLVVFQLSGESFGVDIAQVREIITMQSIVHVPRAPAIVEGIINLRGQVIPVIDLLKRFALNARRDRETERIVVVEFDGVSIGLMVDAVSEVLRINRDIIAPPSPVILDADADYLEGIAKVDGQLIIVLNLKRVLSHEEAHEITGVMRQVNEECSTDATKTT